MFSLKAATSVPKKRKSAKDFSKIDAVGGLLDAFTEVGMSQLSNQGSLRA